MAGTQQKSLLQAAQQAAAVCFAGAEEYLLCRRITALQRQLQQLWQDSEVTRIPGEEFTLEQAVLAAGTISFFSTRRIVRVDRLPLASMSEGDLEEFCQLLRDTENAVFLMSVLYKNGREGSSKKVRRLRDAVQLCGCWQEVRLPAGGTQALAREMLAQLGTGATPEALQELTRRTGNDLYLLENEVEKLAAGAGWGTLTPALVEALAVPTVEADVFHMINAVQAGRSAEAFGMLDKLLVARGEPMAIAGALASSFVDMARMKAGAAHGATVASVYRDLGYTGKDYRLVCAQRAARRFSMAQLRGALDILVQLDGALKSSPLEDVVLLQSALAQLCALAAGRA